MAKEDPQSERKRQVKSERKQKQQQEKVKKLLEPLEEPPVDEEKVSPHNSERSLLSIEREKRLAELSEHTPFKELSVDGPSTLEQEEQERARQEEAKKENVAKAAEKLAIFKAGKWKRDLERQAQREAYQKEQEEKKEKEQQPRPELVIPDTEHANLQGDIEPQVEAEPIPLSPTPALRKSSEHP